MVPFCRLWARCQIRWPCGTLGACGVPTCNSTNYNNHMNLQNESSFFHTHVCFHVHMLFQNNGHRISYIWCYTFKFTFPFEKILEVEPQRLGQYVHANIPFPRACHVVAIHKWSKHIIFIAIIILVFMPRCVFAVGILFFKNEWHAFN